MTLIIKKPVGSSLKFAPNYPLYAIPSLDQRFAEDKNLIDRVSGKNLITFVRQSVPNSATYIDSNGVLQTAASNAPRFDHNPLTGESLGLLVEEQRVQLLQETDALSTQTKTVAAVPHALSFYGTGTIVLSGAHSATVVGLGAYPNRTTLVFTPSAGSLTLTVSGTVQYGQLEAGNIATSYIPNPGTGQVTRAADVISITGSNFSSWYRQDEGTVFADVRSRSTSSANAFAFQIDDGTSDNTLRLFHVTDEQLVFEVRTSGASQFATGFGTVTDGTNYIAATTFKSGSNAAVINGGSIISNATAWTPSSAFTRLVIGNSQATEILNGHIRRITYFPQRLPNSVLQSLTS